MPPTGKAKTWYAWSNFYKGPKCGDEVTKEKLNATDEQWNEWVQTGTVRTIPYPDIPETVAPADHFKAQAAAISAGAYEEAAAALSGEKKDEE